MGTPAPPRLPETPEASRPTPAPRAALPGPGRSPGRLVAAIGVAGVATAAGLDLALGGHLSMFFDLSFIVLCVGLAALVRPQDAFTVGVLPPLLLLVALVPLAVFAPELIAQPGDGAVQAVVTGLATHASALLVGYALCLLGLAARIRSRRVPTRQR